VDWFAFHGATENEDRLHPRERGAKDPMVCVSTAVLIHFELELEDLHPAALIVKARIRRDTEQGRPAPPPMAEESCGQLLATYLLTQQWKFRNPIATPYEVLCCGCMQSK
jgi:hypothetical protein